MSKKNDPIESRSRSWLNIFFGISLHTFFFKFVAYVYINKCLKQINFPISLHKGAHISEFPSYISTNGLDQLQSINENKSIQ